ncbi:histidine kinase dimerization/phosphoacceptor domain -containing protein [Sulfuricurvum sp.]|uniref:histidine kinase dimerization/phosphoacceptor domain -containing protein n=1 Tax=Sulfuricurvum sp. TaxID=2025608 RepID=UPI002608915A|nr:histidine kinase dimerization/phosphoacceptor domain -containing protein [Sulfuricurvum sp.]MDD2781796.1 histidine kinase dimerization/phosphoacceptor domain -containing protein [Sulfuricurvum sp.]
MRLQKYLLSLLLTIIYTLPLYAVVQVDATRLDKPLMLKGEWSFAPYFIERFDDPNLSKATINVPQYIEDRLEDPHTIVTYALLLKTIPNKPLSISLKQPYSVWELYIDGKRIGSSGTFYPQSGMHKAQASYPILQFTPTSEHTQLLLHLGNSEHRHMGLYGTPRIASVGVLEQIHTDGKVIEKIVFVMLTLFGIYHIGIFLAWRKDQAPLWFGAVCLSLAIRTTTTGEKIILEFFPDLSWEMLTRLEYASGYLALPFFIKYFGTLYNKHAYLNAERFYFVVSIIFVTLVLFASTLVFTTSLMYYNLVVVTFILYIFWLLFQSLRTHEAGSILAFSAFILFSLSIIHDLLFFENIILFLAMDLMPYGFIIYLLAQATILLIRYANAFRLIENHTNELETIVEKRTHDLSDLLKQRELLLRELTHRVKNNLQFIIGLLWIQRKEADEKMKSALKTLESQIQSIAAVHETLCAQNNVSTVQMNDYIERLIFSLQRLYPHLEISFDSDEIVFVSTDHTISIGLILNELITNHIKYSKELHPIHLKLTQNNKKSIFYYNDGYDHQEAFQKVQNSISFGLPKLGWAMIKEFVKRMDGEMMVYPNHIELEFLSDGNL